jgi:type III pantothenate kinase
MNTSVYFIADLGNTRLKLARSDGAGGLGAGRSVPVAEPSAWSAALGAMAAGPGSRWAVASVNPPAAARLAEVFGNLEITETRWFRSAADVPLPSRLGQPEAAGADRALAVLAARRWLTAGRRGLVVQCGTAVTVERVDAEGVWEGGAIAPGLSAMALALSQRTAQLPEVGIGEDDPPAWGGETRSALRAGLAWGLVGAVRELIGRQSRPGEEAPAIVWTGGDAAWVARHVEGPSARVEPDLVLRGAALAAGFTGEGGGAP